MIDSELEDLNFKLAEASSMPDTTPHLDGNFYQKDIHVIENGRLTSGTGFSGVS